MSAPTAPHSCELCGSRLILTFGNYYSDQGWYELIDENYYATGEAYVFNIACDEAVSLADQGCELFEWLVSLRRDDTHSESYLRAYFAHNSREQMVLDWVDELDDHIDGGTLERKLIVCAEDSELAAKEVSYRPPNLFPSSEETVRTIKSWLQECFTTHPECQQLQNNNRSSDASLPGPRRLLHLSGDATHPQVRLQQNSSSSSLVEYAALSYCWGGDQAVKLKDSIVESWMKDIPYDQFPQTIKDAMQVTMALGLQYLWIDALCIIQDSNQDKAEQISRMAEIYEQAYITISAARATAVPEGFLQNRHVAGEKGFRMPFTCQDGQLSAVILWQGREPDAWEPIDQRSWCLQESILSPRVLEYGTHSIRWHCARSRADESQPRYDGWVGHSKTFAQLSMSHPLTSSIDWRGLEESYKFVQVWQTLVSHYTRRGLGWYQDKLLAISAIARKMSKMTEKHYIAGLWTEYIGEMLLWHPNHGPDAKEKPCRHATYVAPSWSWASFSGEVDFTFGSSTHFLELLSCNVNTQITDDEFSAVVGARLEIKTLIFGARLRKGDYGWFLWDEEMGDEVDGSLMFDVAEDAVGGEVVEDEQVLLALIMTQDALVLKKGAEEYVRIGIYREGQRATNRARWEMGDVAIV
ncbi:heterokaryon incompatibility domain-containing protein [Trichoderma barbatum]